jgi:hypothetical protein
LHLPRICCMIRYTILEVTLTTATLTADPQLVRHVTDTTALRPAGAAYWIYLPVYLLNIYFGVNPPWSAGFSLQNAA